MGAAYSYWWPSSWFGGCVGIAYGHSLTLLLVCVASSQDPEEDDSYISVEDDNFTTLQGGSTDIDI